MTQNETFTVNQMKEGQVGKIIEISGGYGFTKRLHALGIRSGKMIIKVSSMFKRGPVTIQMGPVQVAIGFRMAGKILVSLEEK